MAESKEFVLTLIENIGGVDIPILSTLDQKMQDFRSAIQEASRQVITDNDDFMVEFADNKPAASAPNFGQNHSMMGKLLGNAKEIQKKTAERARKTLAAIKDALMNLKGESRNFYCVMEILLSRWNNDCLNHLNDELIASIVMTLLSQDDGVPLATVSNRISAILAQMDQKTDFIRDLKMKRACKAPATVLLFKKVKKAT